MRVSVRRTQAMSLAAVAAIATAASAAAQQPTHADRIDLAGTLAQGRIRAVNRDAALLPGTAGAVHLGEGEGPGVAWIEGTEFTEGTISLDVRGRDVLQRSFVGVAFHRRDDTAYEVVYLRPFNFRAEDPIRRAHAVQYAAIPDYDWPRLRKEFPEEFENPVDAPVSPTDWIPLRVVVKGGTVEIYVGAAISAPTLAVRKLGSHAAGQIGLFVGNMSDGSFANIRVESAR